MNTLDATFSALGDSTRRAILAQLTDGEMALSQLAEPFDMSQTAVSRHVRVLVDAGLVVMEKRGRVRHCRLDARPFREATSWLEAYRPFWEDNLSALARYIEEEPDA